MTYQPIQMPGPGPRPSFLEFMTDLLREKDRQGQQAFMNNLKLRDTTRMEEEQDRKERRDLTTFHQQQAQYIEMQRQKAREAIARGDIAGARAAVADVPYLDRAGQPQFGLSFQEEGPPPAPVEPQPPPALAENLDFILRKPYEGSPSGGAPAGAGLGEPLEGREDLADLMAQALGEGRQRLTENARADAERQAEGRQYLKDMRAHRQASEAYPGQLEAYNRDRAFTIGGGPSGTPVRFTEREARLGMRARWEDDAALFAEKHADLARLPGDAAQRATEYIGLLQRQIAGGLPLEQAQKQLDSFISKPQTEQLFWIKMANDNEQKELGRRNAIKVAAMKAAPAHEANRQRAAMAPLKISAQAEQSLNRYLNQKGYKGNLEQVRSFLDQVDELAAEQSPLDTAVAGAFANAVQQRGILTDKDYEIFWKQIGTVGERTEDWVSRALTGKLGDDKRRDVQQAIQLLARNARSNLGRTAEGAEQLIKPAYPEDWDRLRESFFPDYEDKGVRPRSAPQTPIDKLKASANLDALKKDPRVQAAIMRMREGR